MIETRFYDDILDGAPIPRSIFLAGPTAQGVRRTPWRAEVLEKLAKRGFAGTVLLPEFRDGLFLERVADRFGAPASAIPSLRATTHNILHWETTGIEQATVVLFWMPFALAAESDPASLPGFTTRAEVSRELQRDPRRLVLGMPKGALSGGHIRYHAHHAGVAVSETLDQTIEAAVTMIECVTPSSFS
jgi:hypothetical protein